MKRLFITILVSFSALALHAEHYYCDPNVPIGAVEDGSQDAPWRSLNTLLATPSLLQGGDVIHLKAGAYGDISIEGNNATIISIEADESKVVFNSLSFGASAPTSKWRVKGVNVVSNKSEEQRHLVYVSSSSSYIQLLNCTIESVNDSNPWGYDEWDSLSKDGMVVAGAKHKFLYNRIRNVRFGIINTSIGSYFLGNSINYFTRHGIQTVGDNNIYESNLIKNAVNLSQFSQAAICFEGDVSIVKTNQVKSNVIYNYTRYNRPFIGAMMGIVNFKMAMQQAIIENNVVVCDHWHGITLNNIAATVVRNNTVIDPYLHTQYPDDTREGFQGPIGPVRLWITNHPDDALAASVVCNNLVSDIRIEGVEGVIANNPILDSSYESFNETFENWEYLDFRLKEHSRYIQIGDVELAPAMDALGNLRKTDGMVNVGAYEHGTLPSPVEDKYLSADFSDVELRSNGVKDWNGQPYLRLGAVSDTYQSNAIIPFVIPFIPPNYEVVDAQFSVKLDLIQNAPTANVDLYALLVRDNDEITLDDYYAGNMNNAGLVRLLAPNFLKGNSSYGVVKSNDVASKTLADYINNLLETNALSSHKLLLRLSHNRTKLPAYTRWQISSANAENPKDRPHLSLKLQKKEGAEEAMLSVPDFKVFPSPSMAGESLLSFSAALAERGIACRLSLTTAQGVELYADEVNTSNGVVTIAKGNHLPAGAYLLSLEYAGESTQVKFNVW